MEAECRQTGFSLPFESVSMNIDERAVYSIEALQQKGHQAYLVGGCVRDYLLGKEPKDWDVATSAMPTEVLDCFSDTPYSVIKTGLQHGTVTVVVKGMPIEVTTFRADGEYLDKRRPSEVTFVSDLREDLRRRDFTINALAYDLTEGIIDCFAGEADIRNRTIRAVGDPDCRLNEDALRILRALRFSAVLGFDIEEGLAKSIHDNRALLSNISSERISAELTKMLTGSNVLEVLLAYPDVLSVFIPEIMPAVGFEQKNPYHIFDVWAHTAHSVQSAIPHNLVRLTMLFHDLGKPATFTLDSNGCGHFYQHGKISQEIALYRLKELRFDGNTIAAVGKLVKWHDTLIAPDKLTRWLNKLGEELLRLLLAVKRADALAQDEISGISKIASIDKLEQELDALIAANQCYKLLDLAVSGYDILDLGVKEGPEVGSVLNALLQRVIEGELQNDRAALLCAAQELLGR